MRYKFWISLISVSLIGNVLMAQDPDPEKILNDVKMRFLDINDFSVDAKININVDFINIPEKSATLLYKKPDKIKFKSKDFIMVPRKGLGFSFISLLEQPYSAIYIQSVKTEKGSYEEVKIVPLGKKSDIVLATCWIDTVQNLIYRFEADTRSKGYFTTFFEYGEYAPLPDKNIIQFEVDEMKLPLRFMGRVDIDKSKKSENETGEVIITYSDYSVNLDLKDDLFDEEELSSGSPGNDQ